MMEFECELQLILWSDVIQFIDVFVKLCCQCGELIMLCDLCYVDVECFEEFEQCNVGYFDDISQCMVVFFGDEEVFQLYYECIVEFEVSV